MSGRRPSMALPEGAVAGSVLSRTMIGRQIGGLSNGGWVTETRATHAKGKAKLPRGDRVQGDVDIGKVSPRAVQRGSGDLHVKSSKREGRILKALQIASKLLR